LRSYQFETRHVDEDDKSIVMTNSAFNENLEIKIAPHTPGELATMYKVSRKTLRTWLLPHKPKIGKRISMYYTAKQVRMIFEVLGEPG